MAKKGNRTWVEVLNKESGLAYVTTRNKVNQAVKKGADKAKLVLSKYDPKLRKHVKFTETKRK